MSAAPQPSRLNPSAKTRPDGKTVHRWPASRSLLLGLLLLPVTLAALRANAAQLVAIIYGSMSLLTAIGYWEDKRRAKHGQWRIPEASLHLGELLGGWPGAFVAQALFRHKTQKRSFRVVYSLIVASHLYVALDYLMDWRLRDLALQHLRSLFT